MEKEQLNFLRKKIDECFEEIDNQEDVIFENVKFSDHPIKVNIVRDGNNIVMLTNYNLSFEHPIVKKFKEDFTKELDKKVSNAKSKHDDSTFYVTVDINPERKSELQEYIDAIIYDYSVEGKNIEKLENSIKYSFDVILDEYF